MFQHLQDETGEGERSETWLRACQTQDAPSTLSGAHTAIVNAYNAIDFESISIAS